MATTNRATIKSMTAAALISGFMERARAAWDNITELQGAVNTARNVGFEGFDMTAIRHAKLRKIKRGRKGARR